MGVDENGDTILKLADEPRNSYLKFTENYPNSRYYSVISGLYQIYKENSFLYTVDIEYFFIDQHLDVAV
jgi:hypothetical protein